MKRAVRNFLVVTMVMAMMLSFTTAAYATSVPESVTINGGAQYTNSKNVTLTIGGDLWFWKLMKVSNKADLQGASWENSKTSKAWSLSDGDGTKTVYVKFKESNNGITKDGVFTDTIILDTTAPTGSISINNGAASTSSRTVTLNISATDTNGVAQMMISNNPGFGGVIWEPYSTSKEWTLKSGADSPKTVYIKFKDAAGKESARYEDSITYVSDTTPPVITGVINNGLYNVNVTPASADTDIASTALTKDGVPMLGYALGSQLSSDGIYILTVADNAGNNVVVRFTIDKTAPEITIGDYIKTPTNQDIVVTATTNEGTLNADSYTFTKNGEFTFTATDAAGNSSTVTVVITNIDKTPPALTEPADITLEATKSAAIVYQHIEYNQRPGETGGYSVNLELGKYTLSQLKDKRIENDDISSLKVAPGYKVILFEHDNFNGRSIERMSDYSDFRANDFNDKVSSIIVTVDIGEATTPDASDVITNDAPKAFPYGTTTVIWTATDTNGNSITAEQLITISDTTKPEITLNGDAIVEIEIGGTYSELGATASDTFDGDLTNAIAVGGDTVDTNTAGTYTVTYNVSDSAGNVATEVTRTVNVVLPPAVIGDGTGLLGLYYDNIDYTNLKVVRVDSTIDFNWVRGTPDSKIGVDTFSVRWSGEVQPKYSGTYTFYTKNDDGSRVVVNGTELINDQTEHPPAVKSGTIDLVAGQKYPIIVEFFENGGEAVAHLSWSSDRQTKEIIPMTQLYPADAPKFDINVSKDGNGTVVAEPDEVEFDGSSVVTVSALEGYHLASITDDGNPVDITDFDGTYEISNVTANKSIVVTFGKDEKPEPTTISVTGVSIPGTLSLTIDGSSTLTATIEPSDATNKNVTWESDAPTIASVDSDGEVTALAVGTANITVTTADGGKTDTCIVTVSEETTPEETTYTVSATIEGGEGEVVIERDAMELKQFAPDSEVEFLPGQSGRVTFTPAKGYKLESVYDGEDKIDIEEELQLVEGTYIYEIENIEKDYDFLVTFTNGGDEKQVKPLLKDLTTSVGTLVPEFNSETANYTVTVPYNTPQITVTATVDETYSVSDSVYRDDASPAVITIEDIVTPSGEASNPIALKYGNNEVNVVVTIGEDTQEYIVNVIRKTKRRSAHRVTTTTTTPPAPAALEEDTFADLDGYDWAKAQIDELAKQGIIKADDNGLFRPDDNVTRAELADMLVKLLGLKDENAVCSFSDVSEDDPYYNSIAQASKAGIILGYPEGTFKPNDDTTRQDIALMVERVLVKYKGKTVPENVLSNLAFTDNDSIAKYAKEAVAMAVLNTIMKGYQDNTFGPIKNTTRAEAAVMVYNIMELK